MAKSDKERIGNAAQMDLSDLRGNGLEHYRAGYVGKVVGYDKMAVVLDDGSRISLSALREYDLVSSQAPVDEWRRAK